MINNPFPGTPEAERAALRAKLRILPSPKGWVFRTTVDVFGITLQGTNISRFQGTFEDDFPFPQLGYVNSLEGNYGKWSMVKIPYLQFCQNLSSFFERSGEKKNPASQ